MRKLADLDEIIQAIERFRDLACDSTSDDAVSGGYEKACGKILDYLRTIPWIRIVTCRDCTHWRSSDGWCSVERQEIENPDYWCADGITFDMCDAPEELGNLAL